jgi:hypothetical protein
VEETRILDPEPVPEHRRGLVPAVEPQAHRSTGAGEGVTEEDGGDEEDDNQIGEGARRHI